MENLHIGKVLRVGDSLGITIPINVLRALKWQRGDTIVITNFAFEQFTVVRLPDEKIKELKTELANRTIKI